MNMLSESIDPREKTVGIAGAGRVAQALGRVLRERGEPIVALASRTPEHAREAAAFVGGPVAAVTYEALPGRASHLLVAVPDDAIAMVAATLARAGMTSGVVLHTCGAKGPDGLEPLKARGVSCGTLHPFQTFPSPEVGAERLRGISFAVAGDEHALQWAEHLASLLEGRALRIAPQDRAVYHVAGVMASNCITGLIEASVSLLATIGIDEASARAALGPLAQTSVESAIKQGPAQSLTGPIQRGDAETVASHLRALDSLPHTLQSLYRANALQVLEIARRRGLPPAAASRLEELLRGMETTNA